MQQPKRI
jgi:hypothetical protein